jgi:hypothetical protein
MEVMQQPSEPEMGVTRRPSEVLRQVATSMSWDDTNHSVHLPAMTPYRTALSAVEDATRDIEKTFPLSNFTSYD